MKANDSFINAWNNTGYPRIFFVCNKEPISQSLKIFFIKIGTSKVTRIQSVVQISTPSFTLWQHSLFSTAHYYVIPLYLWMLSNCQWLILFVWLLRRVLIAGNIRVFVRWWSNDTHMSFVDVCNVFFWLYQVDDLYQSQWKC